MKRNKRNQERQEIWLNHNGAWIPTLRLPPVMWSWARHLLSLDEMVSNDPFESPSPHSMNLQVIRNLEKLRGLMRGKGGREGRKRERERGTKNSVSPLMGLLGLTPDGCV